MGSAGDAAENWVLDAMFGDGHATVFPSGYWVALYTTAPTDGGGGTEVPATGNNYGRAFVTNDSDMWPNASGSSKANGLVIQFPNALDDWGIVVAYALFTDETGGTLVVHGLLAAPKTILAGQAPFFEPGAIVVRAD